MNATPDRRGLLLGALTAGAAASVAAMPSIAAASRLDPVLGLVEALRQVPSSTFVLVDRALR
jgi:hypothetical protein